MRSIVRPLLAAAIGTLVAQCGEPSLTAPQPITALPRTLSAAETGLITADNRFAFNLFGEIARQASPDFRSPAAASTINRWVSDQTRGKIPTIVPDPIGSDVVAYLINAIYFKGRWTARFDKGLTRPGTFRLANGAAAMVPMMKHGR